MFYPVESLRRGGRFYLCWVADSWPLRFATITHRQLWSQDIREICNDLLEVMKNESGRPTNRFSLRLSSQLLRGLVRLYQRKVTVFLGDLCMINAHVMKSTHKKFNYEESEYIIKSSELPKLDLKMQPDEEVVEEIIRNSGNIVAHIEDITLREPTLPENIILLDDGFGELNPDLTAQVLLGDRSVEMMLLKESSAQLSALSLDASADQLRPDIARLPAAPQMERLSEHEISVFGKSMGEGLVFEDFGKEIPEIPSVPHPDPRVDEELEKDEHKGKEIEKLKVILPEEIELEELEEEPQVKRRKIKNKLVIDKKIKLSSDYIRSRIDNTNVETHRELLLAGPLLRSFGFLGGSARSLGAKLSALQRRIMESLHDLPRINLGDTEAILQRSRRSEMRTILETIAEEQETVIDKYEGNLELQDVSKKIDTTYLIQEHSDAVQGGLTDLADLPTQKLLETSQAVKRASEEQQSPKRRRSGYVSFRHYQEDLELLTLKVNREKIPHEPNPSARLTALLQREGLVDSEPPCGAVGEASAGAPEGSRASETPLGSLDRTKVSLGDSDVTTDSKKFIRDEWGVRGAMYKIFRCLRDGASPLDMARLLSGGPQVAGRGRVIAARCFTSILRLKQHGFIKIYKDSETNEIRDIAFGSKILQDND